MGALEEEANTLQQQLTALRSSELVDKEQHHIFHRENWQRETARLAEIRNARDTLARQQGDLQRQLADRWKTYNIADFVNKIAFVLACWSCAKTDSAGKT